MRLNRWTDVTVASVIVFNWDRSSRPNGPVLRVSAMKWDGYAYFFIDHRVMQELRKWLGRLPETDGKFDQSQFFGSVAYVIDSVLDLGRGQVPFDSNAAFVCRMPLGPGPFCEFAVEIVARGLRESMALLPEDHRHVYVEEPAMTKVLLYREQGCILARTRGRILTRKYFPRIEQ